MDNATSIIGKVLQLIKSPKSMYKYIVSGIAGTAILIGGTYYYIQANTEVIYQVTVDGDKIGYVSSPEIVNHWIEEKKAQAYLSEGLTIDTDSSITFTENKIFNGESNDNLVIQEIDNKVDFYILGVAIKVDDQVIGYVKDRVKAEAILDQYKESVVSKETEETQAATIDGSKDKNTVKIASIDEADLSPVKESTVENRKTYFKETVTFENVKLEESQITDSEEILAQLAREEIEQEQHVVAEGESLWTIADQHDLTVEDLQQLNPDIQGELLQIKQGVKVTALDPLLTVVTEEEVTVDEVIPFATEAKEDSTMPKGSSKVIKEGENGSKKVTYQVKKENGILSSKTPIVEQVTKEPVTRIVVKGTKIIPSRGTSDFIWPVNGGIITSGYGYRRDGFHAAIDIAGTKNKDIKASDNGKVVFIGWAGGFGKSIVIDHNNGYKTRYSHLSSYLVKEGDVVEKGQKIGVMGSTGNSTGTHLDFRIYKNGDEQNPLKYVSKP